MPIKPENAARYPKDWKKIRARILERAGNCCEGSRAYPDCRIGNGCFRNNTTGEVTMEAWETEAWTGSDGNSVTRIVLTIGHLDHTPENCDESNQRAWCQRCHLTYDAKHHAMNSNETRRKGKAINDMFNHTLKAGG